MNGMVRLCASFSFKIIFGQMFTSSRNPLILSHFHHSLSRVDQHHCDQDLRLQEEEERAQRGFFPPNTTLRVWTKHLSRGHLHYKRTLAEFCPHPFLLHTFFSSRHLCWGWMSYIVKSNLSYWQPHWKHVYSEASSTGFNRDCFLASSGALLPLPFC